MGRKGQNTERKPDKGINREKNTDNEKGRNKMKIKVQTRRKKRNRSMEVRNRDWNKGTGRKVKQIKRGESKLDTSQKHNSYDIKDVFSWELISKQHVSAIHGRNMLFWYWFSRTYILYIIRVVFLTTLPSTTGWGISRLTPGWGISRFNTPLSHERLIVRTWFAAYSGWG